MYRTRLHMLANVGHLNFADDPAAPEGGSAAEPQEGATDSQAGEAPQETQDSEPTNDFDALPSWAQAEIKSLRTESGRYRTANKELNEALKGAKSQDDIDAATKEFQERVVTLELELARETHTAGLSDELKALVHGSTPEEIEASATAVKAAFASHPQEPAPTDLDGGMRPGETGGSDPRTLARNALRRR